LVEGTTYNGGGVKGWGEGEKDNLQHEARFVPRVIVHDDAADVAQAAGEGRKDHGNHIGPGLEAPAKSDVDEAAQAEESYAPTVRAERWIVAINGFLNGTLRRDGGAIVGIEFLVRHFDRTRITEDMGLRGR
jgi:hypothetical protein